MTPPNTLPKAPPTLYLEKDYSFYPKALSSSSARSRRVVRTERVGEEVPSGDQGYAFWRPGIYLLATRAFSQYTLTP